MLRRDRLMRMQVHQVMDAALFAVSFWLAYELRWNPTVEEVLHLYRVPVVEPFPTWILFLVLAGPLVLEAQGFYNRPFSCSRLKTAWLLFKGCLFTTLGIIFILFLLKNGIARVVMIWFGGISFLLVFLKEEFAMLAFRSKLGQAQYRRRFLVIGAHDETVRIRAELKAKSSGTLEVVDELDLFDTPMERLVELLHEHSVNGVIISAKRNFFDQVEAAIKACELEGVEVWLVADFFKTQISRTGLDDFYGSPVLVFRTVPEASWESVLKQVMDFCGALVALAIVAIPLLLVAVLVKLTSPGPIFFRQQRSGLNGRPFILYKFRTMVTNAEQMKHELAAMNEMSGPVFKLTNDPRITPLGRFLRKFSIDEFPQLFNVLRGEMSLVGPRPLPVDEVKRFHDLAHRRRLSVKPGLTCLWQISGRNNVKDFKDWVRLDLEYIDNWSLWLDCKILCRTVPVVLIGLGAK
jgi:exopolysaccharide biosynthesis polyprenyl glycosylphosphotransferase